MRTYRTMAWLAIIPAALMVAGCRDSAVAADNLAPRQEQSERGRYADGVYTATGQYGGQPSFITVTVTLRGGLIVAVQVTPQATVPRSLELQRSFAAAVPRVVVGRPIAQVQVGKLAGSSGTPDGFNDAIRKIKLQAAT
ncbi:hypothetical protein [Rhizobium lusitanum]|uniref:hypothetical protein n=1 Tax=Rhizobium lusitanum TaxID=293958 RepID=UPI001FD3049F|nr:hypothetical protein [Rhizobium lusitanum]